MHQTKFYFKMFEITCACVPAIIIIVVEMCNFSSPSFTSELKKIANPKVLQMQTTS